MTPGVNIYSGSRELHGLAAALTNPTELSRRKGSIRQHYPVRFDDDHFPDAEAAYQAHKLRPDGSVKSFDELQETMVRMLVAKLQQHPRLVATITRHGGSAWLHTCRHVVNARSTSFKRWEGIGVHAPFLRCLMQAYAMVRGGVR